MFDLRFSCDRLGADMKVSIRGLGTVGNSAPLYLIESQTNPTIAPYAKTGEVHLRVTASAENEKVCRKLIKPVVKELKKRFGKNVFATDESKTLEEAVIDLLKEKDLLHDLVMENSS